MKNQAFFLEDAGRLTLRDIPMPVCGDDEVVVRTEYMGICGSDLFFYGDHNHEIADGKHPLPLLLGHECAGAVVEAGKNVTHLRAGDRVAVEPGVPCGCCEFCRSGRYNLCPDVKFMAAPPHFDGALRRYFAHPAHMAFRLPDTVDAKAGALIEPLAIGMHAAKRAGIGLGDTVVILGAGCIGLTLLLAAKARGASDIIAVDVHDNRLQKALELGACAGINSAREDVEARVRELLDGRQPAFVAEAAGRPETVELAVRLVGRGGTLLQVGSVNAPARLKFYELTEKEARIIFTFRYANMYPTAIRAIAGGKIDVSGLATDEFDFLDAPQAFAQAERNKQNVVKAVIRFGEEDGDGAKI